MPRLSLVAALAGFSMLACDPGAPLAPPPLPQAAIGVTGMTLEPAELRLSVGGRGEFTVRQSGVVVPRADVFWRSSNPAVAEVSTAGLIRAIAPGSAEILAVSNSGMATARVAVTTAAAPPPVVTPLRAPELPRVWVDTRPVAATGRIIRVPAGGNLQAAINAAVPGDVLELQAGATFDGPFKLPPKSGSGWITIRSSAHANLPEGVRVRPADGPRMARLRGGQYNQRVLLAEPGARNWRLVGLEIALARSGLPALVNTIVELPNGTSHFIFDRTWIHGTPTQSLQRCVIMNSAMTAIIDSWVDDCHARGFDSQAIVGWSGPGPYRIENNYLAGAGENIMFGGAAIRDGNVPSDIVIRRNHLMKPLSWRGEWTVKNAFELKIANRVLFEGNVIENVWPDAQVGFAINLKSESHDVRTLPDIATRDVTIRLNRIINSRYGVTMLGGASSSSEQGRGRTERVLLENNIFDLYGDRALQFGSDLDAISIVRNSLSADGRTLIEREAGSLLFAGNIGGMVKGSSLREGTATFERFASYVVTGNAFISRPLDMYPAGNFAPATVAQAPTSAGADRVRVDQATTGVRR